jgi:hypothetical protein
MPEDIKKKNENNPHKDRYMTGEDIDMLNENKHQSDDEYCNSDSVCDRHDDGA